MTDFNNMENNNPIGGTPPVTPPDTQPVGTPAANTGTQNPSEKKAYVPNLELPETPLSDFDTPPVEEPVQPPQAPEPPYPFEAPNPYTTGQQQYQQQQNGYQPPQYGQNPPPYGQNNYYQPPVQQVYYPPAGYRQKSRIAAALLAFMFGYLGVHNYYLGFNTRATVQLILTIVGSFFTCGMSLVAMAIWGFVEGILLIIGSDTRRFDANGVILKD